MFKKLPNMRMSRICIHYVKNANKTTNCNKNALKKFRALKN